MQFFQTLFQEMLNHFVLTFKMRRNLIWKKLAQTAYKIIN